MTNKPQATLSLVCRYWEQVVVKTPQIWSYIHLSRDLTEKTLRRRIKLSNREPLDVRVDVGDGDGDEYDEEDKEDDEDRGPITFLARYYILLETIDRWRSFVFQGIIAFSPKRWIPKLLPNVVEAAYYGLIENDNEGIAFFDHDLGKEREHRFKPWTTAPKLRRFAVETSGQFYFIGCPLVTEFSISDIKEWWGGSSDTHSWHDKWEEYFTQLAEMCPQLETLEICNSFDLEDMDPMGWTETETKWPQFPRLRTLKLDGVNAPSTIPIISKMDAPWLGELRLGQIHFCLPLPLSPIDLAFDPSWCRVHFDRSPLRAIKLFLEGICPSQVDELEISINLRDALGLDGKAFGFTDKRGDDLNGEPARIQEDWTWITENTRSVQWILPRAMARLLLLDQEVTVGAAVAIAMLGRMKLLGVF
ncbi:hypothetical protein FRC00_002747 [Tulasnella sp. 408]|nr:hypothetical protein FRC00_002747 [Tulasnella sp. 408]